MDVRRETVAGWAGFVAFLALSLVASALQPDAVRRAFYPLVGLGVGGVFGIMLALAVHLARSDMPGPVWVDEDPIFADDARFP